MSVANEGALNASGDFAVRLSAAGKPTEFHQLNGDKTLAKFGDSLQATKLPISLPDSSGVEVPLRGTLTCHSEEARCRFAFLTPEEAVNVTRNEIAMASATPATGATRDPHVYDDPAMGMRIFLPDNWKLVKVEPGSFSHPRNAMFGKSGSLAMFMLTREHFKGSLELYLKVLDNFFSKRTDFRRTREEKVTRDGLIGTRWNVSWNEMELSIPPRWKYSARGRITTASQRLRQKRSTTGTQKRSRTCCIRCNSHVRTIPRFPDPIPK